MSVAGTAKLKGLAILLVVAAELFRGGSTRVNASDGSPPNIRVAQSDQRTLSEAEEVPAPKRRYRIGVLFPFLATSFWVNEAYGVLDQAKKVGAEVVWTSADGYANVDRQNKQIDDMVAQKVDAILLAAASYSGTAAAVDRATSAKVPVFTHVTSSSRKNVVSAVLDDDLEIGRKQARYMDSTLHNRGQIVMLNGPAGAEWSMNRVKGFKEVIQNEYSSVSIVAECYANPDRATSRRIAEDLLTTFPQISGIFTVADEIALGVINAVAEAKRSGSVVITTASFSRETVPYIKDGTVGTNIDENPILIGRIAINTLVRSLNGETVSKIIYVPNPRITKDNIGEINPQTQWAPEGWRIR